MPPEHRPHPPLRSAIIHVCPLTAIEAAVASTGAAHLITVINAQTVVDTPKGIGQGQHLRVSFNDIKTPQPGLVHPQPEHIAELLRFVREWDHSGPLVVHCWAGISRSTATAFITQCALNDEGLEHRFARAMRDASATASPNPLMVAIADDVLGRRGRMVDAIRDIGEGEPAISGTPFSVFSRLSD